MWLPKETKTLAFDAEIFSDLDKDPDLAELFSKELKWRLEKAVATAMRVTEQKFPALCNARFNERLERQKREIEERIHKEHEEQVRKLEEEHERWMKNFAESLKRKDTAPEKESPIRRDDETQDQFLLRMADNANARRKWAQKNLNK